MRQMNFAGWLVPCIHRHTHTTAINLIANGVVTAQRSALQQMKALCESVCLQPYLCKNFTRKKNDEKQWEQARDLSVHCAQQRPKEIQQWQLLCLLLFAFLIRQIKGEASAKLHHANESPWPESERRICCASKYNAKNTHLHKMLKSKQINCTGPWRNDAVILVHVFLSHFLSFRIFGQYVFVYELNSIAYFIHLHAHLQIAPFRRSPLFAVREISAWYLIIDIRSSLDIWFGCSFASNPFPISLFVSFRLIPRAFIIQQVVSTY